MASTTALLQFAEDLARQAGEIILEYFDRIDKVVETKSDNSPVTIADKKINQLVIDAVAREFPSHGVLAEEGSSHETRNELWVCDPIDGTASYIHRIPTALFSLAFVVDGITEVAVIGDPFQGKIFSAIKGKGAAANGLPISISRTAELSRSTITLTSNYKEIKKWRKLLDNLEGAGASFQLINGNVFRSTLVASGHADGYIFPGRSAHDIAASKLIIEEAGGKVTDLNGKDQRYDSKIYGAIISNGRIHDELVKLVAKFSSENFIGY